VKKRIIAVLAAFVLGLIWGWGGVAESAAAARGPHPQVTNNFVLNTDDTLDPYASDVATIWNKTNLVSVAPVDGCSGPGCINAFIVQAPCDRGVLGCTYENADGSYNVELASFLSEYGYNGYVDTLAHETGHGIIMPLGGGTWHASNPRDLMYGSHYPGDPVRHITIETRNYIKALL
jgi:hypothetical protein